MKKMMQKLRSRAGESISEVLIAMLVSALGLAMLAGVISTSVRIINNSKTTMKTFIQNENALEQRESSEYDGLLTVSVDGAPIKLTGESADKITVSYTNRSIGRKTVVSYR